MSTTEWLSQAATLSFTAWLVAPLPLLWLAACLKLPSWLFLCAGVSCLFTKQVLALLPAYEIARNSPLMFNFFMSTSLLATFGAGLIIVGAILLIVNYHVLRVHLEGPS